ALFATAGHKVDIYLGVQAEDTIDDGAAQQLFPVATRWLAQHDMRDMALASNLDQRASDVPAFCAYDLGSQVLGQQTVFFQVMLCLLPLLAGVLAVSEPTNQATGEGRVALRLNKDGNQFCIQPVS